MFAPHHDKMAVLDRHDLLRRVVAHESMTESTARQVASQILDGRWSDAQIAALLAAIQSRGESVDELAGFVTAVRERAVTVPARAARLIDTCGTGGTGLNTVNVSTAAAIVAAAAGCNVAKHGNRAASGRIGSSDVIQALGVALDTQPDAAADRLDATGITFLHAPAFHRGLRRLSALRKELRIRTIFNLVGPLANPAGVRRQLVGVCRTDLLRSVVEVLDRLGSQHVLAVHGKDGADEITLTGASSVCELRAGSIHEYEIVPEQFGFTRCEPDALRGGNATDNAARIRRALDNKPSPVRDVILMNAGAAIYVGELAESIEDGVARARETVRSGDAADKLEQIRTATPSCSATRIRTA